MVNQTLFLNIMARFIHPQTELTGLETPAPEEIGEMLAFAQSHLVLPAVYDAIKDAQAFHRLPEESVRTWKQLAKSMVIGQIVRTDLFLRIYRKLCSGGVTPLVLKGIILRNLYPQPDSRCSMDEDLLIRKEEFAKLDEILRADGFAREAGENLPEQHEITYFHVKTGMRLEVHLALFPETSDAYGRLNALFDTIFEHPVSETIQGTEVYTPEPALHMLYLICHALKHFMHSGFGIRQVCDMVLYAEAYGSIIPWEKLTEWTAQQNMYVFWMNLFEIGERYLGFSWEKAHITKPKNMVFDCEALLADLLDSGIYGKRTDERIHSANIVLRAAGKSKTEGNFLAALFPDFSYMEKQYPYLHRHKWLLPAAWVQRMTQYLGRNGKTEIRQTLDIGRNRIELLKKYGIIPDDIR